MKNCKCNFAICAGLFVALGLPFILDLFISSGPAQLADVSQAILFIAKEWGVALLLLAVVLLWERQSLTSIGFRKMSWRDMAWAFGGLVVGVLSFGLTIPLVQALNLETTEGGLKHLAQIPVGVRIGMALTAGITEEIVFRGYPIERLNTLTGHLGLSAAIAYLVFVLLHVPIWGLGGAIQIGVWSLVITLLYVKRRNLPACILMHVLNDAYAFVLLPMLLTQGSL